MAARAALFSLLKEDVILAGLGLGEVYPTNSVDTPMEDFFAIIQWGITTTAYTSVGSDRVTIWLHDRNRDYGRVNAGLKRIKDLLLSVIHREGGDGWVLSVAEWQGESQDLWDEGYSTVTRYADFAVVSRYASV